MHLVSNNYLRKLHTLTGVFYLVPAYLLYNQNNYLGSILYIFCSFFLLFGV